MKFYLLISNFYLLDVAVSATSFRQSFLYVFFFASNVWLITRFCSRILKLTESKIAVAVLFVVCILAVAALLLFVGRVSGELVRFDF